MEMLRTIMVDVAGHPWALLILAAVIICYQIALLKAPRLPGLPFSLLYLFLALKFVCLVLPQTTDARIFTAIAVAADVAILWAGARLIFTLVVESWWAWQRKTKIPRITRDLFLAVSYAIILLIVMRTRGGVNLIGLITTSAVLTAVIGLAAQNTLGNIFAGLSIQMDHPFRLGDWVEYGNNTGKVVGIGWAATRLKTFDDEMIIVPNTEIAKTLVKNHSLPTPRHAMKIDIGVEYGAAPEHVRKTLLLLCTQEPRILKEPPPVVRVTNYGDFAITCQLRFFYNDFGISPELRANVMDRIWYTLRRAGIKIPFPIRDVHHRHIERKAEMEESARIRDEAISELDLVPILAPLLPADRKRLALGLTIEEYGNGEIVVEQGNPGDSLYIIHRGVCDVEISTAKGPPVKVATLARPAFFGEMSLLTGEPRSATVRSVGHTIVFSIDKELFRDILLAHPEVSEVLAATLATRQAKTMGMVERRREEEAKIASGLLGRIRSFFGLA